MNTGGIHRIIVSSFERNADGIMSVKGGGSHAETTSLSSDFFLLFASRVYTLVETPRLVHKMSEFSISCVKHLSLFSKSPSRYASELASFSVTARSTVPFSHLNPYCMRIPTCRAMVTTCRILSSGILFASAIQSQN